MDALVSRGHDDRKTIMFKNYDDHAAHNNQAEKQRLLQAAEVALARVREMETKVDGLRRELEEVEEKEKEASALKATSTGGIL